MEENKASNVKVNFNKNKLQKIMSENKEMPIDILKKLIYNILDKIEKDWLVLDSVHSKSKSAKHASKFDEIIASLELKKLNSE